MRGAGGLLADCYDRVTRTVKDLDEAEFLRPTSPDGLALVVATRERMLGARLPEGLDPVHAALVLSGRRSATGDARGEPADRLPVLG